MKRRKENRRSQTLVSFLISKFLCNTKSALLMVQEVKGKKSCSTVADLVVAIWLHSDRWTRVTWHVFFKWASAPVCSDHENDCYKKLLRCTDELCLYSTDRANNNKRVNALIRTCEHIFLCQACWFYSCILNWATEMTWRQLQIYDLWSFLVLNSCTLWWVTSLVYFKFNGFPRECWEHLIMSKHS